ncbi:MAG: SurA N-terminal domain-containing protein, partial [Acidobacteriota bacterium]
AVSGQRSAVSGQRSAVSLSVVSLFFLLARAEIVDQVAALVDTTVITFSDVHWLAEYRDLAVPEEPQARRDFYLEVLEQVINQKIITSEAEATPGIQVTAEEIDAQVETYKRRFGSEEAYQQHLKAMEMSEAALRDIFRRQLAVNEFVQLRFRPFIIVLPDQIEQYYREEFAPQAEQAGQLTPPLEVVEESIRQILIEEQITEQLDDWLADQRRRSTVRVLLYRRPRFAPNLPQELQEEIEFSPVPSANPQ